jgi:hypothetical protein
MRSRRTEALLVALLALSAATRARADEPSGEAPEALTAFVEGTTLVKQARWGQALVAFERAAKIRPHAITTYNIGACERALGLYTRARKTFQRALSENEAAKGGQLPDTLVEKTRGYLGEIDGLLAHVTVTLVPEGAAIAVDGRPLETTGSGDRAVLVAGTLPPGPGAAAPARPFEVLLDPGAHVFSLSRKGFSTAVVNRTVAPGTTTPLKLELDRLPATMRIGASQPGAIVTVNGSDVGPSPVDVLRPAGSYKIVVKKDGRIPYETRVAVQAGEEIKVHATLLEDKPALTERWWFWTAAGVVVAGAAIGTYAATRTEPEPTRAAVSGGSFGWKVKVP